MQAPWVFYLYKRQTKVVILVSLSLFSRYCYQLNTTDAHTSATCLSYDGLSANTSMRVRQYHTRNNYRTMSSTTFETSSSSCDTVSSILRAMWRMIDKYKNVIKQLMREMEEMVISESPTDGNSDKMGELRTKLDGLQLKEKEMKDKMHELADDDQNPDTRREAEEMLEKASNEWEVVMGEMRRESREVEQITQEWLDMTTETDRLPSILEEAELEE